MIVFKNRGGVHWVEVESMQPTKPAMPTMPAMPAMPDMNAGDPISVFWELDKKWYNGEVVDYDEVAGICNVLYTDGEREAVNLSEVKFKKEWTGDSRVSTGDARDPPLDHVKKILLDIDDRLPLRAVTDSRKTWWLAWKRRVEQARKNRNVEGLAQATIELASQLRDSITFPSWKLLRDDWKKRIEAAKTEAQLADCVQDLQDSAVDWPAARELFDPLPSQKENKRKLIEVQSNGRDTDESQERSVDPIISSSIEKQVAQIPTSKEKQPVEDGSKNQITVAEVVDMIIKNRKAQEAVVLVNLEAPSSRPTPRDAAVPLKRRRDNNADERAMKKALQQRRWSERIERIEKEKRSLTSTSSCKEVPQHGQQNSQSRSLGQQGSEESIPQRRENQESPQEKDELADLRRESTALPVYQAKERGKGMLSDSEEFVPVDRQPERSRIVSKEKKRRLVRPQDRQDEQLSVEFPVRKPESPQFSVEFTPTRRPLEKKKPPEQPPISHTPLKLPSIDLNTPLEHSTINSPGEFSAMEGLRWKQKPNGLQTVDSGAELAMKRYRRIRKLKEQLTIDHTTNAQPPMEQPGVQTAEQPLEESWGHPLEDTEDETMENVETGESLDVDAGITDHAEAAGQILLAHVPVPITADPDFSARLQQGSSDRFEVEVTINSQPRMPPLRLDSLARRSKRAAEQRLLREAQEARITEELAQKAKDHSQEADKVNFRQANNPEDNPQADPCLVRIAPQSTNEHSEENQLQNTEDHRPEDHPLSAQKVQDDPKEDQLISHAQNGKDNSNEDHFSAGRNSEDNFNEARGLTAGEQAPSITHRRYQRGKFSKRRRSGRGSRGGRIKQSGSRSPLNAHLKHLSGQPIQSRTPDFTFQEENGNETPPRSAQIRNPNNGTSEEQKEEGNESASSIKLAAVPLPVEEPPLQPQADPGSDVPGGDIPKQKSQPLVILEAEEKSQSHSPASGSHEVARVRAAEAARIRMAAVESELQAARSRVAALENEQLQAARSLVAVLENELQQRPPPVGEANLQLGIVETHNSAELYHKMRETSPHSVSQGASVHEKNLSIAPLVSGAPPLVQGGTPFGARFGHEGSFQNAPLSQEPNLRITVAHLSSEVDVVDLGGRMGHEGYLQVVPSAQEVTHPTTPHAQQASLPTAWYGQEVICPTTDLEQEVVVLRQGNFVEEGALAIVPTIVALEGDSTPFSSTLVLPVRKRRGRPKKNTQNSTPMAISSVAPSVQQATPTTTHFPQKEMGVSASTREEATLQASSEAFSRTIVFPVCNRPKSPLLPIRRGPGRPRKIPQLVQGATIQVSHRVQEPAGLVSCTTPESILRTTPIAHATTSTPTKLSKTEPKVPIRKRPGRPKKS